MPTPLPSDRRAAFAPPRSGRAASVVVLVLRLRGGLAGGCVEQPGHFPSLCRIEATLEQRAEDHRFDARPVQPGRLGQCLHLGEEQLQHVVIVEQAAVEPGDGDCAEPALSRSHLVEQLGQHLGEAGFVPRRLLENGAEDVARQKPGILREQAEDDLVQEMRDPPRIVNLTDAILPLAQILGQRRKFSGSLLGDSLRRDVRPQCGSIDEASPQKQTLPGIVEIAKANRMRDRDTAREQSPDLDLVDITGDRERRIVELGGVLAGLRNGRRQSRVLALALVLPDETASAPDIGEARSAAFPASRHRLFEGEALTRGIVVRRLLDFEQLAQLVEMILGCRPLRKLDTPPFGDEGFRSLSGHRKACPKIRLV